MTTGLLVAIIVIVVVVLALAWFVGRQMRTTRLRKQFGPEYERVVSDSGNRQAAERELEERRTRREKLEIVPLDAGARDRYLEQWHLIQARFVDSPPEATRSADRLINEVMRERGYPVEDFDQRAADISVDHPQVVDDYRAAHAVAEANERSEATTEDLRQALVHYRSLFEELLEVDEPGEPARRDAGMTGDESARRSEPVAPDGERAPDEPVRTDEPVRSDVTPVRSDVTMARDEAGMNDVRPPAASTPPQRRTTEEAR